MNICTGAFGDARPDLDVPPSRLGTELCGSGSPMASLFQKKNDRNGPSIYILALLPHGPYGIHVFVSLLAACFSHPLPLFKLVAIEFYVDALRGLTPPDLPWFLATASATCQCALLLRSIFFGIFSNVAKTWCEPSRELATS